MIIERATVNALCGHSGVVVVVIVWYLDLQLPVQSVPITTNIVSSNLVHGEVYSIQHYVIKFVSDLRQFGVFLRVLRFPPPIKLTSMHDITEILLKVAQTPYETKPVTILNVFCCFLGNRTYHLTIYWYY
jgi:hypothetical protein